MAFDRTNRGFLAALGFAFAVIGGAFLLLSVLSLVLPVLRDYGFTFTGNGFPWMPLGALVLLGIGLMLRKRAPALRSKAPVEP